MRRVLPLVTLGVVLAITASGCALLRDFFRTAFKEPELRFKTVNLREVTLGGAGINTVWTLENPNSIGLSLAEIDYAFTVEGKQVVAGKPANGLQIPAHGRTELVFPADVKFQDLAQTVGVFLNKDTAKYRAQGHIGIKTPIGVIRLPISKEGTFEVPKLPALKFDSPRITNVSISGATLEIPLQLTNKNSFPLPVSALTGQLSIAGANVGAISNTSVGMLSAKGTQTVMLPVKVNFLNAASAASAIRGGGSAQIHLDGQLQSGQTNLPVSLTELHKLLR